MIDLAGVIALGDRGRVPSRLMDSHPDRDELGHDIGLGVLGQEPGSISVAIAAVFGSIRAPVVNTCAAASPPGPPCGPPRRSPQPPSH